MVKHYGKCYFSLSVAVTVARGVQEIGADRVGIRLSPYGTFNDATDDNPHALYMHLCAQLRTRGIAYVHMIESRVNGATDLDASSPQVRNPSSHIASSPCYERFEGGAEGPACMQVISETLTEFRKAAAPLPFIAAGGYCLLYTSPSPRDRQKSRMPSSA